MRKIAPSLILFLETFYSSGSSVPGKKNKILYFFAHSFDLLGFDKAAAYFYTKLEFLLRRSDSYLVYKSYQLVMFLRKKKTYNVVGRQNHPEDPLFLCSLKGNLEVAGESESSVKGYYMASWTHLGLKLEGYLLYPEITSVNIKLDGIALRDMPVSRIIKGYGFFSFTIKRDALELFPEKSLIKLSTDDGHSLLYKKSTALEVLVPHGNGTIIDQVKKTYINKKGHLVPSREEVKKNQDEYLEIYEKVRGVMLEKFDKPVFLMYGTLLGHHRDGELIEGDDDFDVGYWSDCSDVESVKRETKKLVVDLVLSGFTCSFNRKGRLFRIALPESSAGVHLDIRPVWYEDDHVWAHRQAKLPLSRKDFLPVKEEVLRGKMVFVPSESEAFLASYYGKGWKVPDPSYSNEVIPSEVKKYLNRTNIRPAEYREMCEEISQRRGGCPNPGRFIAIGLTDLYAEEVSSLDLE